MGLSWTLNELEDYLGIKQPTISMRLKRLNKHGYILLNGRDRQLTDLGHLIVDVNILKINDGSTRADGL